MVLSEKDIFYRLRDIFAPTTITDPLMERIAAGVKELITEELVRWSLTPLCGWKADDLRMLNDKMAEARLFKAQLFFWLDSFAKMELGRSVTAGETLTVQHTPKPIHLLTPGQELLNDKSAEAVRVNLDTMKPPQPDKIEFNVVDYTSEDESLGNTNKIFADEANAMKYAQALANTYGALGIPHEIDIYKTALILTLAGVEDED